MRLENTIGQVSKRRLPAAAACALLSWLLLAAGVARADRVLVLERSGHVRVVNNPFLNVPSTRLQAARGGPAQPQPFAAIARASKKKKRKAPPPVTLASVLAKLVKAGQLSASGEQSYLAQWNSALSEEKHLPGARAAQLSAVTVLIHNMAAAGQLTAARLPVVFLTLARNAQWWQSGALVGYGARVQFYGSNLVWQYYPGAGLQLQVLGTFGEADAMYTAGPSQYAQLSALLSEMQQLAVPRAGGIAWEYYFPWEGGAPGWVSAMSQATGIEAFTRGYLATGNAAFLQEAQSALPLLQSPPPSGVGVRTPLGMRYVQYSFASGRNEEVINAFLQTLIGLYTLAHASGNPTAQTLFAQGDAEAQAELPSFNTGAWSLYQPGQEDDLSYHQLVTGFLQTLCTLTSTPLYCSTASAFQADLTTAPTVAVLGNRVKPGRAFSMRFRLSKISKVGVVLTNAKGKTLLYTSGQFPYGIDSFKAPALKRGSYSVRLSATDLAGNVGRFSTTLTVP